MDQDELKARLRRVLGKRLRQVFKFSGLGSLAKKLQPYCSECGSTDYLEADHEPPVAPVDRDITDPLEYFKRMFLMDDRGLIDLGKLNVLCSNCHAEKCSYERQLRIQNKTGPYSSRSREKASLTRSRKRIRGRKRKRRK